MTDYVSGSSPFSDQEKKIFDLMKDADVHTPTYTEHGYMHITLPEFKVKELEVELTHNKSITGRAASSDAPRSTASSSISPHLSPAAKFEPDNNHF